ncbi:hypothetical protein EV421DRAFT_1873727 [Armillaria borealis]|uniref:Uncharacterized protein n=1 Tax=Armillaria borealis TaxID=47425 RepID=A0AA39IED7_9AGAR|nr:hypothetical protein EV421DRAFT_1873727 [Armillaria borealis]
MGCREGIPEKSYGVWGMGEVWVMAPISLGTRSVEPKIYGVWESMGYGRYGLGGRRLYIWGDTGSRLCASSLARRYIQIQRRMRIEINNSI